MFDLLPALGFCAAVSLAGWATLVRQPKGSRRERFAAVAAMVATGGVYMAVLG